MRLIDAERLKDVLEKNFGHTGGADVMRQLIDIQPTIVPKRRKGKWIAEKSMYSKRYCRCSECGCLTRESNFCPSCGADMTCKVVI